MISRVFKPETMKNKKQDNIKLLTDSLRAFCSV